MKGLHKATPWLHSWPKTLKGTGLVFSRLEDLAQRSDVGERSTVLRPVDSDLCASGNVKKLQDQRHQTQGVFTEFVT